MESLKQLIKAVDDLPKIAKLLLALPFLDIVWAVYRVVKSLANNNTLGVVLGVILVIVGIPFLWLVDMVFIALDKPVLWLD